MWAIPESSEKARATSTKSVGTVTIGFSRIASKSSSVISSVNSPEKLPSSEAPIMRRAISR